MQIYSSSHTFRVIFSNRMSKATKAVLFVWEWFFAFNKPNQQIINNIHTKRLVSTDIVNVSLWLPSRLPHPQKSNISSSSSSSWRAQPQSFRWNSITLEEERGHSGYGKAPSIIFHELIWSASQLTFVWLTWFHVFTCKASQEIKCAWILATYWLTEKGLLAWAKKYVDEVVHLVKSKARKWQDWRNCCWLVS